MVNNVTGESEMGKFNGKRIGQIFLLTIIISIGFALIDAKINGGNILKLEKETSESMGKGSIDETKEFDINAINQVLISTVSSDVNIILSKDNDIKLHFQGKTSELSRAPKLEASMSGDKLDISIKYPKQFMSIGNFSLNTKLDVYIPEDYKKYISIQTVSGRVNIDKLEVDKFKTNTVSGNININSIIANTTDFGSVSGDIKIKELSVQGSIFKTTSADVEIETITGDIKTSSVSGSISLLYKKFNNDVQAKTVSGEVELSLPEASEFKVDFSTLSGELDNEFPLVITGKIEKRNVKGIVGDGNKTISIETVSGDADIDKR